MRRYAILLLTLWGFTLTAEGITVKQYLAKKDTTPSNLPQGGVWFVKEYSGSAWITGDSALIAKADTSNLSTWSLLNSGIPVSIGINCLEFVSSTTIFAGGMNGAIYESTNGGISWNLAYYNASVTNFIDRITFFDSNHGFAWGDGISSSSHQACLETTDGGATWNNNNSQLIAFANFQIIQFVPPSSVYLAGSYDYPATGLMGIWKSGDAGHTWSFVTVGTSPKDSITRTYSISFKSSFVGVACRGDSTIWSTSDGGATWQQIGSTLPARFGYVSFVEGTNTAMFAGGGHAGVAALDLNSNSISVYQDTTKTVGFSYLDFPTLTRGYMANGIKRTFYSTSSLGIDIPTGPPNNSVYFDGNARIRVTDANRANPGANPSAYQISGTAITVEAWIFPMDVPTGNDSRYIIARPANTGFGTDPYQTFALFIYGNAPFSHQPRIGVSITDGTHPTGTGYEVFVEDTAAVKIGQWTHVAGTYDGTNVKLYINGVMVHQLPLGVSMGGGSTGLYVGGASGGYFKGMIDEVRLWNIVRTPSAIQSTMNSTLVGNETGLAGYWPLDSTYTAAGGIATVDKTANHNDLYMQFDATLKPFPEGVTPQIAATAAKVSTLYAVSNALYKGTITSMGWPKPQYSLVQGPSGMTINGDTLFWIPTENPYGSFPTILSATNIVNTVTDTVNEFSEVIRSAQNQIHLDFTHRGKLGALGWFNKGMLYNGKNGLYAGDFSLVDRKDSKYAGGLYSGFISTPSFSPAEGFTSVPSRIPGFTALKTSFTDVLEPNRIGVHVLETVYSSTTPGDNKYAIIEFRVVNTSGAPLEDLFAQLTNDIDVGNPGSDLGGYDSLLQMNYGYEQGGATNSNYYGFSLLNKSMSGEAVWIVNNPLDTPYVRSTRLLTQEVAVPLVPGDIRNQISSGPFSLATNDTLTVAFAVFAGDNLSDIRQSAARARNVYSPPPWKVRLTAAVGSNVDAENYLGVSLAASDGFDGWYDLPKPPAPTGNYVQLYFPHPEYGLPTGNNITQDMRQDRSLADTAIHWYFEVNTNVSNTPVNLTFLPSGIVPSAYGILLKDITAGTRKNLKTGGMNYSYSSGAGGIHKFEIIIGDSTAPTVSLVHPNGGEIVRSGANYSIQWNISDRVGLDSIRVLYSTNAGTSYNWIATVSGSQSSFNWTVPPIYLNYQGSVALVATDSMGNTAKVASSHVFTFTGDSLANVFAAGWNLMGTPLKPNDSTVAGNFSDDINGAYYVYDYLPLNGYTTPNALLDGHGYWLGLLSSQTVDVIGKAITDSIVVPLAQGFNMVSNPLIVAVPKTGLIFSRGGSGQSYQSAIDTGWIAAGLTGFNSTSQNYQFSDTLQMWNGYWLGVLQAGVSVIVKPPPSNIPALLPSTVPTPKTKSQTDWQINIVAQFGTANNLPLTLGVKSDAALGFNAKYDVPKAPTPPVAHYVETYFLEPTWAPVLGSKFVSSFLSLSAPIQWTFYVSPSDSGTVTLSWDSQNIQNNVPANITLTLRDNVSNQTINMRSISNYSFSTNSTRQLAVLGSVTGVGLGDGTPTDYALNNNFPNPFNPSTVLSYALPARSNVKLEIYNVLGQRVAQLVDGQRDAGVYTETWNASQMSSGIYLYRLEATALDNPGKHFMSVRKMILLR